MKFETSKKLVFLLLRSRTDYGILLICDYINYEKSVYAKQEIYPSSMWRTSNVTVINHYPSGRIEMGAVSAYLLASADIAFLHTTHFHHTMLPFFALFASRSGNLLDDSSLKTTVCNIVYHT